MQNTLIYNELWKDVCNGDKAPTKPNDARESAKWELKDEKALALLKSSVSDAMFTLKMQLMLGMLGKSLRKCLILNLSPKGLISIQSSLNKG